MTILTYIVGAGIISVAVFGLTGNPFCGMLTFGIFILLLAIALAALPIVLHLRK